MTAPIQKLFASSNDGTITVANIAIATGGTVDRIIDISGGRYLSLLIKNDDGANAIDSGAITISPLGTLYAPLPGFTFASIAANAVVLVTYGPFVATKLKVHLGSTSGASFTLEYAVGV